MPSDIEKKINLSGNSITDFYSLYRDILGLNVEYAKKDQLLQILKNKSFLNGVDLNGLIIPKPTKLNRGNGQLKETSDLSERKKKVQKGSFLETMAQEEGRLFGKNLVTPQVILDNAEYKFLEQQIAIFRNNFPFLQTIVFKNGVQIEGFKSAVVCCAQISTDYLNTYFTDVKQAYIPCRSFSKESSGIDESYIFILFWPQDKDNNEEIIRKIQSFENIKYLDIKAFERKDNYWRNVSYLNDDTNEYRDLRYDIPLVNVNLSTDQEMLIRKAVKTPTGFLTYRILEGGYTGALVLEVTSVGNGHARKKFVLKIDKRDKRKGGISEEFRNFQEHIENIALPDGKSFSAQKFDCGELEAIKYPFASVNSLGNSESFGEFFKNCVSFDEIKLVLKKVFTNHLILNWCKTNSLREVSLFDAFEKLDSKINSFYRMKEFSKEYRYDERFDFDLLSEHFNGKRRIVYCTSHGDLHVDNIRVDASDSKPEVFFIDFGRTGLYPMGIDYAALECSIRYKILDSAFPIKDLEKVDDELFNNFAEKLRSSSDKISKINYAISLIREAYLNNFPTHHKALAEDQYFLCLFAISSWLIDKPNLNRQYIWRILFRIYRDRFNLV